MIAPVILCGGSGTRLWPLSRKSYPKQFVPLLGDLTLFQASAQRLSGPQFRAPLVLTGADFRFIVGEQLAGVGIEPDAVLIEPSGRNTAPAVLAAALWQAAQDADALLLVAPSAGRGGGGRCGTGGPARDLRDQAHPCRDRLRLSRA
jgi:mannose-1-phosphate guanylyltransferase/mannose-1-phosphate guanylyltransferase/mannose-6-phosphate isomerase